MESTYCLECVRFDNGICRVNNCHPAEVAEVQCKKTTSTKKICYEHGEYISFATKIFGIIHESNCPVCDNEYNKKLAEEEEKARAERRIRALESMRIREKYRDATFESCTPSTPAQSHALKLLKRMAEVKRGTVVLLGANGVGKTHYAISALQEIGGKYYTMFEISCIIRSTYAPASKVTEFEFIEELCNLPLLVIDEFGRSKVSTAELNWLSYIIDRRKADNKPTIIISNARNMPEICRSNVNKGIQCNCDTCQKICFSSMIGSDIISRLNEESAVIEIDGSDRRVKNSGGTNE